MNYYLIKDKHGNPTALMSAVDKTPMIPLHQPKTASYFDDKSVVPISKDKFDQFHTDMIYPTEKQVNHASREQLCTWWRFLPSPGSSAIGTPEFGSTLEGECKVLDHISAPQRVRRLYTTNIKRNWLGPALWTNQTHLN